MTALIGGICIGVLAGLWITRRITRLNTRINEHIHERIRRHKKLDSLIQFYGKEGQTKKTEGKAGPSQRTRD